ncbi:MAG: NAD(P)/FAD-dependent oxidoreductase [Candidatus Bathyarchaeota archaeon]|nr:NAD(P)/FAD-dependent oxidoreductase [Candidatus Bathyarchaeota archaeon]
MKTDVIVVGAGPAGLTAARAISSRGFNVAILERERHLGVKPCGEAVSKKTINTAEVAPSKDFIIKEITCASIYAPNGRNVSIEDESGAGYILNKTLFLQNLAEKAAEAGTHIYMNQAVVDVTQGDNTVKVKTKSSEWQAPLLLGADGFSSIVSRKLAFEKAGARTLIPCIQYKMVNCNLDDPNTTAFYMGNNVAPLGYVWVFPTGRRQANVGIGVQGKPAKPYLDRFIKEHPSLFSKAEIIGIEAAPVTISGVLERIVDENVMLVGEAAGQVIPFTGGGIHSSIAAGTMAANTAVKALEEENFSRDRLKKYADRFNELWGKRIRDSLKALHVIERLNDNDLNALADILEPQDIINLVNGSDIATVARKLLRHPLFSLKIAKTLLTT